MVAPPVCIVVTTFYPQPETTNRIGSLSQKASCLVIVDNTPADSQVDDLSSFQQARNVHVISNGRNVGVATALNQGVSRARSLGFEWALLLDQDSEPADEMLGRLWNALMGIPRLEQIALLAPQIIEASSGRPARFLRPRWRIFYELSACRGQEQMDVTCAITSGSLLNIETHSALGGFRDDFFTDYVDTEYCLRALLRGYRCIAVCDAILHHRLGHRREIRLGPIRLFPTFHTPERWYTVGRNRIEMIRTYGLRVPHWLAYEIVATHYTTGRMLLLEPDRERKLKALMRGAAAGLFRRMGAPSS